MANKKARLALLICSVILIFSPIGVIALGDRDLTDLVLVVVSLSLGFYFLRLLKNLPKDVEVVSKKMRLKTIKKWSYLGLLFGLIITFLKLNAESYSIAAILFICSSSLVIGFFIINIIVNKILKKIITDTTPRTTP